MFKRLNRGNQGKLTCANKMSSRVAASERLRLAEKAMPTLEKRRSTVAEVACMPVQAFKNCPSRFLLLRYKASELNVAESRDNMARLLRIEALEMIRVAFLQHVIAYLRMRVICVRLRARVRARAKLSVCMGTGAVL